MDSKTLRIAGNDYPLGWSLDVYKEIKKLSGTDFNHIRACVFDEINQINSAIGKPPGYYADIKQEESGNHTLYATKSEYHAALEQYNATFDLEFTRRITEHVDLGLASVILYCAAKSMNSKVELAEMEENVFIEGIRPSEKKSGYQYIITQYISWTYTLDDDSEGQDVKKHSGGSLLKRLITSLTT